MAASSPSSDACRSAGSRLSQNRRGTRILRAAGLVTLAVASALGLFTAQAVATPYSAKLYWGADDAVGTATVDATGTPVSVNLALATGCTGSNSFSTNGTVLVTNIEGQSGFCMQDIDGTNRRTLATDSSVYCPERMLAQVATISYIYYACREYPGLGRISIDGNTSVRQFATAPFSWIRAMTIDVNWIYFMILPVLAPGVLIHIHDVTGNLEYPQEWIEAGRAWNEQYLLRAFLMHNSAYRIELFSSWLLNTHRPWFAEHMPLCLEGGGGQMWLRKLA